MFNSKLKKQIEALEDRIWQLENPTEYKIGQKVNIKNEMYINKISGVVADIEFRKYIGSDGKLNRYWKFFVFNPKLKKIQIYS